MRCNLRDELVSGRIGSGQDEVEDAAEVIDNSLREHPWPHPLLRDPGRSPSALSFCTNPRYTVPDYVQ